LRWLSSVWPGSADDVLDRSLRAAHPLAEILSPALEAWQRAPNPDKLQRTSYQYCKTYLEGDILTKVDRASMAVGLEVRSPFLDSDVVALLTGLPASAKLGWFAQKRVLRVAVGKYLPRETLRRPKKGFGVPVASWLRGPLRSLLLDYLSPDRIKSAGYLRPEVVSRLVDEHLKGRRNNRKVLWTLLMFEIWRERFEL
ncbi:MAG: hypothetical protein KC561_10605, partial [Myxococcales bacterium]|nr:hypothetical protein [Myxococcales bacterium]